MNWNLLLNSLLVASAATLIALICGVFYALWLSSVSARVRKTLLLAAITTAALPPFLVVNSWIDLFGRTGTLHWWLPFDLYSLTGTVVLLAFLHWPVAALLVSGAWRQLDPELWEADPELRGAPFIRRLLLPQAKPALVQSAALIFVLSINQFSIPAILQVKVYPAELWVRFNTTFDYREALLLSWPMLVFPLLLIVLLARRPVRWPVRLKPWASIRPQLTPPYFVPAGLFSSVLLGASLLLPLGQLLLREATWAELRAAWYASQPAVWSSVMVAGGSVVLLLAAGWWTSRYRLGAMGWPLFFLPGVLVGLGLIFLLNRNGLDWVYRSMAVMFVALLARYFAPAWYGARLIRQGMDRDLVDAGRLNGATGWHRWALVDWPQVRGPLLALGYVIYLLCLWDVETVNLIMPPGGETLALKIFNLLHYGHNDQVNALCLMLLGVALLPALLGIVLKGLIGVFNR